jgi:hypothetical protein
VRGDAAPVRAETTAIVIPPPASNTDRALTAKAADTCDEHLTVSDLKLDVGASS